MSSQAANQDVVRANIQAEAAAPPRILIVDDDRLNVMVLSEVFDDNYDILFATDGATALSIATSGAPDLILLDVMMPGMDGHEVCRRLKANPATRDIPVIFVTGMSGVEDEVKGLALGAVDYLVKPVVPAMVLARVSTQLALTQARRELRDCTLALQHAIKSTVPHESTESTATSRQFAAPSPRFDETLTHRGHTMETPAQVRILVVDDELINVKLMTSVFGDDYEVIFATYGEQALALARAVPPDLILLDVMMAGMDGYEVCRRLKADEQTRDIPVIFVTAHMNPLKEIEGLDIGAVDYITKPINPAVVRARVRTHLSLARATREVQEFNTTLERQIELRTAELKTAMESVYRLHEDLAASEARATLSTLIASVSHELATPIGNSVLTSGVLTERTCDLMALFETGNLKRSQLEHFLTGLREAADLLQRNLYRARDLLLNFKQVAVDQASEQRREFDLAETVNEVIAALAPSHRNKPHRVVLEIPNGILMRSLPGPLGQVVINLINNAYLHAFEGRSDGVLTIGAMLAPHCVSEDATADVTKGAAKDAGEVVMFFSDNGIGIPEENLARMFDPFFSTKIGQGGSGLGMAIVDSLVRKSLGGSLAVQSTVNIGTRFEIRLPVMSPSPVT